VDADDELNWRSDLPTKYSDLKDEHFPLFITFDRVSPFLAPLVHEPVLILHGKQLCTMIENDMAGEDPSALPPTSASGRATGPTRLTYDKFLQNYWPHFPQSLSKGLGMHIQRVYVIVIIHSRPLKDPSLVFSEFMGVLNPILGPIFSLAYVYADRRDYGVWGHPRRRLDLLGSRQVPESQRASTVHFRRPARKNI
jgi:hypothetical protein